MSRENRGKLSWCILCVGFLVNLKNESLPECDVWYQGKGILERMLLGGVAEVAGPWKPRAKERWYHVGR